MVAADLAPTYSCNMDTYLLDLLPLGNYRGVPDRATTPLYVGKFFYAGLPSIQAAANSGQMRAQSSGNIS